MDSNTIKEIANQLGIATDAVTKEVIPAYAQFEIGFNVYGIVIWGILFIIALSLTIFFVKKGIIEKEQSSYYDARPYFISGGIIGTSAIVFLILLITAIAAVILWMHCPYGSFVNIILAH